MTRSELKQRFSVFGEIDAPSAFRVKGEVGPCAQDVLPVLLSVSVLCLS